MGVTGCGGAGTVPVLAALLAEIAVSLFHREVGLDIVAALSMSAALAFDEPLAGNVVALMYAGGQHLESYAEGRARREMTALLGRVARTAMRYADGGSGGPIESHPCRRPHSGPAWRGGAGRRQVAGRARARSVGADRRGAAGPPRRRRGASGSTSVGRLSTDRDAAGGGEHLCQDRPARPGGQDSKAPSVRLADRYAIWFLA